MELRFDNRFVREMPADPDTSRSSRQVLEACFSQVAPVAVREPRLIAYSREVAALLGLEPEDMNDSKLVEALGGNRMLEGMQPYAACYGGHQFGNWAGQLGDGRAISLGEVAHDGRHWELQLKGAGETPYSRGADGRAVMRSSVREFLCSESMHHLGVPTTRALSLVSTGDTVVRDMFYDGNEKEEPGAIVCRVAPSFLRFGNFEIFTSRNDLKTLRVLADYTIKTFFAELGEPSPEVYAQWLGEVARRTATMIAHWMRVGFVHGVMNTDNMSVLGLTIDYGPYGWLDVYDPSWTPNTTDASGRRYRFGNQPPIAWWNLIRLANALHPLVGEAKPLEQALQAYPETLEQAQKNDMAAKIGLRKLDIDEHGKLVRELLDVLAMVETDMTIFYRRLADFPRELQADDDKLIEPLKDAYYQELQPQQVTRIATWLREYQRALRAQGVEDAERRARMNAVNPKYVLRNYLAQVAIDEAEQGDGAKVMELLEVLRRPYDEQPAYERYAVKRPEWARHRPGCSMLSCSS